MKHAIDPKIDCVFKALLGAEHNRPLLLHFLNAILADELSAPLAEVEILNPYNDREFIDDKLSVVDVKARDSAEQLYQIEIQLLNNPYLPARILYGWADLYSAQLQDGQGYEHLHPTYSIWLLGQTLRPQINEAIHHFRLRDEQGRSLLDHGGIWLLELSKCVVETVNTEQQRWLKFFIEGGQLNDEQLPVWMHTQEMQQAMSTLRGFSEKERAYHRYQARQNYLREQKSLQHYLEKLQSEAKQTREGLEQAQVGLEQAQAGLEQARAAEEQARAAEEQARAAEEQARAAEEQARTAEEQARTTAEQAQTAAEQARTVAEQAQTVAEQARAAEERERAEKEAALAEIERLKALLPK